MGTKAFVVDEMSLRAAFPGVRWLDLAVGARDSVIGSYSGDMITIGLFGTLTWI